MEHELVSSFDDFFELTRDELLALPKFKEKSADNLLAALAQAKRVPMDRFLAGLSIPHVGEETAYLLATNFGTLETLQKAAQKRSPRCAASGKWWVVPCMHGSPTARTRKR
jgi:DNA ligase (NAD+)